MAQMHEDEVDTGIAVAHRLIAGQFPAWAHLPLEPVLPSGTDNALYRLGANLVVRLPRRQRCVATLAKERRWLPVLAPRLPLPVPLPLAQGAPAAGFPFTWSLYRWLPGESAAIASVGNLRLLAADLAGFLTALQRIDPSGRPAPGPHNFFRGEPLARRDAATRAAIARVGNAVDAAVVTAAWEQALRAPAWTREPVWIHGDLDRRNLLVCDGRVRAVIDFGGLGVGDPACDAMLAWKFFDRPSRECFRAALCIDADTWTRSRGWALSQALAVLSYYTQETNAVLVREARRWLAEVLAG